jgi:hypothetical protein
MQLQTHSGPEWCYLFAMSLCSSRNDLDLSLGLEIGFALWTAGKTVDPGLAAVQLSRLADMKEQTMQGFLESTANVRVGGRWRSPSRFGLNA